MNRANWLAFVQHVSLAILAGLLLAVAIGIAVKIVAVP